MRYEEKNHRSGSMRYALCALLLRPGAAAEESTADWLLYATHSTVAVRCTRHSGRGCASWATLRAKHSSLSTRYAEGKSRTIFPILQPSWLGLKVDVIVATATQVTDCAAKRSD